MAQGGRYRHPLFRSGDPGMGSDDSHAEIASIGTASLLFGSGRVRRVQLQHCTVSSWHA